LPEPCSILLPHLAGKSSCGFSADCMKVLRTLMQVFLNVVSTSGFGTMVYVIQKWL
jgi:hypothetical protein